MNKAIDPALMHAAEATGSLQMDAYWMPFTANRQFKKAPRLLTRAEGMHYWDVQGRQVLDGVAGLWCVNAGHARPRITKAIQDQAAEMDFAPPFQMGHPKAFELAERVAALAPAGMNKVFFVNSGSEAVETALKMALAYHRVRGEASRTRLIGRERGYHGVNFGGISVGGMVANRKWFGAMLGDAHREGVARRVVGVADVIDAREQAAEHLAVGHHAAHRDAAEVHAVVATLTADEAGAGAFAAHAVVGDGHLQRRLDRLGAGVGEEDAVEPGGGDAGQAVGQLEGLGVAHLEGRCEVQLGGLLLDGLDDALPAMPGIDTKEPGRRVDHLAPVGRQVVHVLGA